MFSGVLCCLDRVIKRVFMGLWLFLQVLRGLVSLSLEEFLGTNDGFKS